MIVEFKEPKTLYNNIAMHSLLPIFILIMDEEEKKSYIHSKVQQTTAQ